MTASGGRLPLMRRTPASTLVVAVCAVSLLGCATPESPPTERSSAGSSLVEVIERVRANPERRAQSVTACTRSLRDSVEGFRYEPFMAGLFDVPVEEAGTTFCSALIEAVISDALTAADLAVFRRPRGERSYQPLGDLFRELLEAHERLGSQEAKQTGRAIAAAGP
ncbi:hypothetical protein [Pelagibius sp.]|uniref:hypothetical protein n=1 Tax=Pelagibius sp. TaxID=1931238 RepID=UPI00262751E9|nr:hypothetical protein [Pelagibius sp.]